MPLFKTCVIKSDVFQDLAFLDIGVYTCYAENKYGDVSASCVLIVRGEYGDGIASCKLIVRGEYGDFSASCVLIVRGEYGDGIASCMFIVRGEYDDVIASCVLIVRGEYDHSTREISRGVSNVCWKFVKLCGEVMSATEIK